MQRYDEGIFGVSDDVQKRRLVRRSARPMRSDARYLTITRPVVSVDDLGTMPVANQQASPSMPGWLKVVLVGAGVGMAVHLLRKSGWLRNPSEETPFQVASRAAAIAVQANIPVILWGPPGIGKTEWITALAKTMGLEEGNGLEIVIGSTRDPADVVGVLMPKGDIRPPMWVQNIRNRSRKQQRSVLFLDEFSLVTPLVQAAFLRVIRDKIAGEARLEEGCGECVAVVAAANKPEETVGGILLPPPSANRMIHIPWPDPDPKDWIKGLLFGWEALRPDLSSVKLPGDWKSRPEMQVAKKDIAEFIGTIGQLSEMPKDTRRHFAWPSPRSWDNAAKALGCARIVGASKEIQSLLIAGAVGQAQADEFVSYTENKDLPDPENLLKRPKSWSPKEDAIVIIKDSSGKEEKRRITRNDIIYAVMYSVVLAVQRRFSIERWKKAWEFIKHMDSVTGPAEKSVVVIGASGLMDMVGKFEGLSWDVVAETVSSENLGHVFAEMEKAGLIPKSAK